MIGTVDLAVLPNPIIAAGSILCLCFYNRLYVIIERLRKFDRELIEEHDKYEKKHDNNSAKQKPVRPLRNFAAESNLLT